MSMIEIFNVNPINKNGVLASCSVRIVPWKMTMHHITIIEQGQNRWINLPSRSFESKTGEKKYEELITFDDSTVKKRFRDQIMQHIDKLIMESGGELKAELAIKETDECPF